MPKISQKGKTMPASPIRKLVPFSDAAKERGVHVYHLNIGQPDIETPPLAMAAVRDFNDKVIKYSHSAGNLSYRKRLCRYYHEIGIEVTPDDIIVTQGASEALLFVFETIMDPDDEVIIPEPFYANYNGFAQTAGVKVKPIFSSIENGFALPPIADFEKVITPHTKAIMICNPNNPTGYLYSKEELEVLKQLALKYDLYLIADEVYREFCYDGSKHTSLMHLSGIEDNVIMIDSASKRYSACGIRVGRLVTKNKEVITTAMKFAQARLSPPSLGQVAAEAVLDTPKSYFGEVVDEYQGRRDTVVEGLKQIEGAYCPVPKGAFYIVAHLPIDNSETFCKWMLTDFSYEGKTVMMAPACGFYSTPNLGTQEVRISYCLCKEDLKDAMMVLKEALKVYPGRKI